MRAAIAGIWALGALISPPSQAAPSPKDADQALRMQMEAVGDRWPDRWQGRHHYLYDEESMPRPQTEGFQPADANACVNERMRLRRADGSTVVVRMHRCK